MGYFVNISHWLCFYSFRLTNSKGCTVIQYMIFAPNLQSGQADPSCQNLELVCRFELTDFIENCLVYDGYKFHIFGCPLLWVCAHCCVCALGWIKCRARILSMGHHTWLYVTSLSLRYIQDAICEQTRRGGTFLFIFPLEIISHITVEL